MIRDACFPSSWKEAEVVNLSCEGRDEITGRVILDFVKVIWLDHHFREYLLLLQATSSKSKYFVLFFEGLP